MAAKRKICFPITSRAYYGRSQLLLKKLQSHPDIELKLMLGGAILLDKYSKHVSDDIAAGGFEIEASLFNVIEGGNHVAMAKTACLTALVLSLALGPMVIRWLRGFQRGGQGRQRGKGAERGEVQTRGRR